MLLARYAPVGSGRNEKLAQIAKSLDKVMGWLPAQLFGIWTTFVAGMSTGKAHADRFYFWDWNDWLIGIMGIIVITAILNVMASRFDGFPYKVTNTSLKERIYHGFIPLLLLYIGFVIFAGFDKMFNSTIYLFPYLAIFMIYTINIENNNNIPTSSNKYIKTIFSILLFIVATILGFIVNDPVIATASMVSLPFLLVLLFGKNVRHLERAKFYPIFIFAMFVSSREAWFLIPLLLLFFILRNYNYLRYQKVYPTFGVSNTE